MLDVIMLALAFIFFALSVGYAVACDRLWGGLPWSSITRSRASWPRGWWFISSTRCSSPSAS